MPDPKARNSVIPLCVLVLLLIVSVAGWKLARDTLNSQSLSRFELEANHLHEQIETRFDTYAQVLRGGVGLFNGSDNVTREEWYHYVKGLELPRYFPGIQGVGFSYWIGDKDEVAAHEEVIRAEGFPTYAVKPAGDRDEYTSIVYLEPFNKRNREAFGYDMFSQDTRRTAMERARDSGQPALSGKVELLQEISTDKQAGFLLYLPVYHSKKKLPETVAQRRASLSGFVYSPFRANDLMKGILQQGLSTISFRIYDDSTLSEESILYDGEKQLKINRGSTPAQFETAKTATIAGRKWFIRYSSTPLFTKTTDSVLPWVLLATGVLLSLLMAIVAWMLLAARMRVTQRTDELRKQEKINSVLLENLAEGVVACDASFDVIFFNKVARKWFCVAPGQDMDHNWSKRVRMFEKDGETPVDSDRFPMKRAVGGETISSEELCIVADGQEPRFVLITGGPLPDSRGQKSGAVISLRDITEYRDAVKNIERQQNFLSDVINNIPNLINAKDSDGNHVLANKAYSERIHGLSPEKLLARHASKPVKGLRVDDEEIQENRIVIERGMSLNTVRRISLLDGEQRWFSIGKLPIRSNNSAEFIVLTVASDITDLKLSEERVRTMNQELESRVVKRTTSLKEANRQLEISRQAAENANLAKSSFLAAMSHEIRTPMNGVVGMVEVLMGESLNSEMKNSLQMVLDSAFSLLGIIDDILDFSKIEAGHFELDKTEINLTELVENVVRASVPLARKTRSSITLYIDPEIPERISVDVTRLRQVLTNLIGNAIKFSGNQKDRPGRVEVRVVVLQSDPLLLQMDFIDNGVGMTPDTLDHIFESFVQAESSITRRFGGSGLGLAICKRIVDMMHGEILVESQLGEGSLFSVRLSLDVVSTGDRLSHNENLQGVNCVVVGSDEYNSVDIGTYLETAKATVHHVSDFHAAVDTVSGFDSPSVLLYASDHSKQSDRRAEWTLSNDIGHVVLSRDENSLGLVIRHISLMHGDADETIDAVVVDYNALRRKTLMEAVAIAIGRASPEVLHAYAEESALPKLIPLSVAAAMELGSCILVAEDDSVNRLVISRQLKLLGHTVEFAENGQEALTRWREGRYGLIFTDLHMPVMDGYTLTRNIRQEETPGRRIPIVALTANALSGEPRRAADAGVDGYLTKPLQLHTLKDAIRRYLVLPDNWEAGVSPDQAERSDFIADVITDFDPKVLQRLLGDDPEIIIECLEEFLISLSNVGHALVGSIRSGDWVSADQLAHRLKSSSLSTGALKVWTLCKEIESARIADSDVLVGSCADELLLAIEQADRAIRSFVNEEKSGVQVRKAS